MAIHKYIEAHCSTCRGTGYASEGKVINGEWWESFHDCHCVTYRIDPETKALIEAALRHSTEHVEDLPA